MISREELEKTHKPRCFGVNPDETCMCVLYDLCIESIESDTLRN